MPQLIKIFLHIAATFGIGFIVLMLCVSPLANYLLNKHDLAPTDWEITAEKVYENPNTGSNNHQASHPTDYTISVRRNLNKASFNKSDGLIDLLKDAPKAHVSDQPVVNKELETEVILMFEAKKLFLNGFSYFKETYSGDIPAYRKDALIQLNVLNSDDPGKEYRNNVKD